MPVKLKIAFNQNYAVSGMTFNWTTLAVKVQNLGFDKDVDLFFSHHGSSSWQQAPLLFQGHYGNYDVFGSNSTGPIAQIDTFAIRYRVGVLEYWDNNGGSDYLIGPAFAGTVGGNVMLGQATAFRQIEAGGGFTFDTGWFEGEILVNNLTFEKRVGLVYSRDGGVDWEEVEASYAGPVKAVAADVAGVERWKFKTPQLNIDLAAADYRFAVFFEVPDWGVTFWDNNFGQDYFLSKAAGSQIE